MAQNAANFDEIRGLIAALPGPDLEAGSLALAQTRASHAGGGGLGRLDEFYSWLATWQGRSLPDIRHPRLALFIGAHGAAVHLQDGESAGQRVARLSSGTGLVSDLCQKLDADLRLYELAVERPTRDFTIAPSLDEAECARAIAYGMMAVEPGIDALAIGVVGPGSGFSAAAMALASVGGEASDWAAPSQATRVDAAVARHRPRLTDPFEILRCLGGLDIAAAVGAILAARMARIPVVIETQAALAAAAILFAADRRAIDHCVVADLEPGPGPARLAAALGQVPILSLGMAAGEGAAAALALSVLRTAIEARAETTP
jgi:nicotinate-nucleotide--dimethylbenzimidazole phosphoribosyltransferase